MASKTVQRRLIEPGLSSSLTSICPSCRFASLRIARPSRRHASTVGKFREKHEPVNKHLGKYLNRTPEHLLKDKEEPKKAPKKEIKTEAETKDGKSGGLVERGLPSEESIFGAPTEGEPEEGREEDVSEDMVEVPKSVTNEIDPEALLNVIDPEPAKTMVWQRKKIMQQIRKRGVLTKEEMLKRTEREIQVPSAFFETSTKKLMHLARQIAGKPIEEAIVQMQLSKKKTAQDVWRHLEYAKNLAVVERGMGLGRAEDRMGEPVEIELKDGKRKLIRDETGIYVDQAWVNKGEETMTPEYRGRGRVFKQTHRTAKITVILKEEATRIRLSKERQEKLENRKLWLHLPDRPITLQRQYPLW